MKFVLFIEIFTNTFLLITTAKDIKRFIDMGNERLRFLCKYFISFIDHHIDGPRHN